MRFSDLMRLGALALCLTSMVACDDEADAGDGGVADVDAATGDDACETACAYIGECAAEVCDPFGSDAAEVEQNCLATCQPSLLDVVLKPSVEAAQCQPTIEALIDVDMNFAQTCALACGDDSGWTPDVIGAGAIDDSYTHIAIVDTSDEENMAGTAGVDICGLTVVCDGQTIAGDASAYQQGDGMVCSTCDGCDANRNVPTALEDDGSTCEAESDPSDYVSLGLGGIVTAGFGQAINGCSVEIVEIVGRDAESYEVYACRGNVIDASGENCDRIGQAEAGGDAEFAVPAE